MPCPFTGPKMFCASPNVLCHTKNLLCQSQKFCARTKDDLHSVKLVFVLAQKFLKRHYMQSNFWAGSKNFGTCKRTRHKAISEHFGFAYVMGLSTGLKTYNGCKYSQAYI